MSLIFVLFSFLLSPPAHAETGALCLSDGQVVRGVPGEERARHRTVRIDAEVVRVPTRALGNGVCESLTIAPLLDPLEVRSVVLADGQVLYGRPVPAGTTLNLGLLDGRQIHLPEDLVSRVDRLDRHDESIEILVRAQRRARWSRVLRVAGDVGLGVVAAAALGGGVYGVSQLPGPRE